MKFWKVVSVTLVLSFALAIAGSQRRQSQDMVGDPELAKKIRRFAPTVLMTDLSHLAPNDRKALTKIIQAAKLMDPLFLRQVWGGNEALQMKLEADRSAGGRQLLHYFLINDGPWSRLDSNEPFIEGVPHEKPPQANYYPDDVTKQEFNAWVQGLSEAEKQKATGFFYLIRRGEDGKLKTVPYSEAYAEFLEPAAKLLQEAAALTSNKTLKNFLTGRAAAFASDDYYSSDVA